MSSSLCLTESTLSSWHFLLGEAVMAVVLLIGQKSLWWVGIRSHYLQGCVYPKCRSPTDWVCCFRCRLLTRGNLQNIKHGLLVRHHDTRKWMHKPECCFFWGGGHMIFFHQNSQGVFLVNSSCVTTLQNQSSAMIYQRITLQGMSQYLSWNVCPTIYLWRRYVSSQEGKTPNISGEIESVQAFRSFVKEFI